MIRSLQPASFKHFRVYSPYSVVCIQNSNELISQPSWLSAHKISDGYSSGTKKVSPSTFISLNFGIFSHPHSSIQVISYVSLLQFKRQVLSHAKTDMKTIRKNTIFIRVMGCKAFI